MPPLNYHYIIFIFTLCSSFEYCRNFLRFLDHPVSIPPQQTQYLPPISLSNQTNVQQRYVTSQPTSGSGRSTTSAGNITGGMQSHSDIS